MSEKKNKLAEYCNKYKVFVPSLSAAEKPTNRKWKKSHLFQVNYRVLKLKLATSLVIITGITKEQIK